MVSYPGTAPSLFWPGRGAALAILLSILVLCTPAAWGQIHEDFKLLPSDGQDFDLFGIEVAVWGGVAVVGAPDDDDSGWMAGAAYVFCYDDLSDTWIEEAKLHASDGAESDYFGRSVSISGDAILIGAIFDDDNGSGSGSAYVFRHDSGSGSWIEEVKLVASDGQTNAEFGNDVSISGKTAVIGAHTDNNNGIFSGSAYTFRYDAGSGQWQEETKLIAGDPGDWNQFGYSVSVDGDLAVVGAYQDDDNGFGSGSATIFRRDPGSGSWTEETKLLAPDGAYEDQFGYSVSISGDLVLVGSYKDDDNGNKSGSAYTFRYDSGSTAWLVEDKLLASDGQSDDYFGISVCVAGDNAVIGASERDDNGSNSGSAYTYRYDAATRSWVEVGKLLASDGQERDLFGRSVARTYDMVLVGAPHHDDNGSSAGAAYVFHEPSFLHGLSVLPEPLQAGQFASFALAGGYPYANCWLVYSLLGSGYTPYPQLDIVIEIARPKLGAGPKVTNDQGEVEWSLPIPSSAAGLDIWFQAIQNGMVTNVVATTVQ